jgi:hypothetical protein
VVGKYSPAAHARQEVAPDADWKYPRAQLRQLVEELAEYLPGTHGSQAPLPAEPCAVPAAQLVHALAPAFEYVPGAHTEHGTTALGLGSKVPTPQLVQLLAAAAENVPGSQLAQDADVAAPAPGEYRPDAQATQLLAPRSGW